MARPNHRGGLTIVIQIRNLKVNKAGKTICQVPDLEVKSEATLAVIGPNGSGKTTLLRVIAGLETAFTGSFRCRLPCRERVFVHQVPYLFRGSVLFNAAYGLAARNRSRREQASIAQKWLDTFGIGHLTHARCADLSGGEQRRVALARAFATEAKLLVLDEPFADLDNDGIEIVCRSVSSLRTSTVLISSPVSLPEGFTTRSFNLR